MPLLNGKIVEADKIDPAKHKFIGTFRPASAPTVPFDNRTYICEFCRQSLPGGLSMNYHTARHWREGYFDEPQYVDIVQGDFINE